MKYDQKQHGADARRLRREIADLEKRIAAHGYAVDYVQYCEDARTPGFLGQIRGVCDHALRKVKIGIAANPNLSMRAEILAHELHHLDDPDWKCGSPRYGALGDKI